MEIAKKRFLYEKLKKQEAARGRVGDDLNFVIGARGEEPEHG
jgi:hypothetical protein